MLTSEQAAQVRGVDLATGAKALILKASSAKKVDSGVFYLAVFSASLRFDSKKFRKLVKASKLRFASVEEVYDICYCKSGAVPPFGSLFNKPIKTIVDSSLSANVSINFNCGLRTHSVQMLYKDFARIENI